MDRPLLGINFLVSLPAHPSVVNLRSEELEQPNPNAFEAFRDNQHAKQSSFARNVFSKSLDIVLGDQVASRSAVLMSKSSNDTHNAARALAQRCLRPALAFFCLRTARKRSRYGMNGSFIGDCDLFARTSAASLHRDDESRSGSRMRIYRVRTLGRGRRGHARTPRMCRETG